MASRWLAFLVWAALGGSATAWLLNLSARPLGVPAHAIAVDTAPSLRSDLTRLFGKPAPEAVAAAPPAAAPASDRFRLIGVVAPAGAGKPVAALALIAVDGKPPRAFRVGAAIDGDAVLQAVRARAVDIGPGGGPPTVTLELAPLGAAATGTLPPAAGLPAVPPPARGVTPGSPIAPGGAGEPSEGVSVTPQPVAPVTPPPTSPQD